MPEKYKILITGSGGMLGVDLWQELRNSYEVLGLDAISYQPSSVSKFYKCDITKRIGVSNVAAKARPDIVIHTAAMTDVDGCELDPKRAYKVNSDGTKNVALACKAAGALLIYISTDFVFDGKKKGPYKEIDKTRPISVYGDSKLKGEKAIKRTLKKYFILRTSWLYGKHGKNFVDTIISKAKSEKALKVVDDQVGSPTYTKDLAKAIHVLVDNIAKGQGALHHSLRSCAGQARVKGQEIYHVSNSGEVSWYDYAKEILKLAGSGTRIVPISSKELNRPAKRPAMSVLDNTKFIELTGYRMRNWREALKEYV